MGLTDGTPDARRLVFTRSSSEAGPRTDGVTYVVLDTAWTPGPGMRSDVVTARTVISTATWSEDLFRSAMVRLDTWAEDAGIPEALTLEGVCWWYPLRPELWAFVLERLVWLEALRTLGDGGGPADLEVPDDDRALVDAARALGEATGRGVRTVEALTPALVPASSVTVPRSSSPGIAGWRELVRRLTRGAGSRRGSADGRRTTGVGETAQRAVWEAREAAIEARLPSGVAPPPWVLFITQPRTHHAVHRADSQSRMDSILSPLREGMERRGFRTAVAVLQTDHRKDDGWAAVEHDQRLIPVSFIVRRHAQASRDPGGFLAGAGAAMERAVRTPFLVGDADLAPAVVRELSRFCGAWLEQQRRLEGAAEGFMAATRPAAVVLSHERLRTPWVAAARRREIPVFAVQHGVIHDVHLDYVYRRTPGLERPDVTFVYGEYERSVLREFGGYRDEQLVVSGSPRSDLDRVTIPADRATEREDVRRQLGVAPGAAMLVVSTAYGDVFRRYHGAEFLERFLREPLPGTHVVLKLHPAEQDDGPYVELLRGLARADGHDPTPLSVIRDIDLYRLLRAADAHLGLYSTVLTDAVVAGTPNLIAVGQPSADFLGYVAAGVAVPVRDARELRGALLQLRPPDPAARQAFLQVHFREGDASEIITSRVSAELDRR
jgi:hypothetical protein